MQIESHRAIGSFREIHRYSVCWRSDPASFTSDSAIPSYGRADGPPLAPEIAQSSRARINRQGAIYRMCDSSRNEEKSGFGFLPAMITNAHLPFVPSERPPGVTKVPRVVVARKKTENHPPPS